MLTFNSCTKCVGSPGTTACLIATQLPDHGCMDDITTESRFDSKLIGQLICFGYFLHVIRGCSYNQALAEVVSPGAAIKCVYCNIFFMWISFLPFASDRNIPNYMVIFLYKIGCKKSCNTFFIGNFRIYTHTNNKSIQFNPIEPAQLAVSAQLIPLGHQGSPLLQFYIEIDTSIKRGLLSTNVSAT